MDPVEPCSLRERKKLQTRRDLHRAAMDIAVENGVDAVTVDAVTARAGVSARTFFNYFDSKDDALIGYTPQKFEHLASEAASLPPKLDVFAAVRAILDRSVRALEENPELWERRRQLATKDPRLGLVMLGVMTRLDREVVHACVERERNLRPENPPLVVAAQAGAAMGAARSAIRAYLDGQGGNLTALIDEAYAACGWSCDSDSSVAPHGD